MGDDVLVAIAKRRPEGVDALAAIPGFPAPLLRSRAAADILEAIGRAAALPENAWPELRLPTRVRLAPEVEARAVEIKRARDEVARALALDPVLIASRSVVEGMAKAWEARGLSGWVTGAAPQGSAAASSPSPASVSTSRKQAISQLRSRTTRSG